jgi:hypothetical protein
VAWKKPPPEHKRCQGHKPQGRCSGVRLANNIYCEACAAARRVIVTTPIGRRVEDDAHAVPPPPDDVWWRDPLYAQRVEHWLGDPKKLLDWRHTMARAQALADMLEDRVRRGGDSGMSPPALLAAVDELRLLHLAIAKLEGELDTTTHVHVSILNSLIVSAINVLTEFVAPERLGAALDKLRAMLQHAVPGSTAADSETTRAHAETNGGPGETVVDDNEPGQ